jgi:hypothetical protein
MKTYLLTYQHDGAEWVIELKAANIQDAQARMAKLAFARLDGELVAKLPASTGPATRLAVWFRNLFSSNNIPPHRSDR